MENCENLLIRACGEVGVELSSEMLEQFKKYFNLLVEWNEKINLTAITEENEVYFKHFVDCVYLAKFLKNGASVCDIGTGAGFPGLVLKIVRPDINLTLVDSLNKRINFLNLVVNELSLKNVNCLHFRAEDKAFKDKYLNSFDYVVARAVARLNTLTEYCLPYVKVGGSFLAMKSIKADEEVLESQNAIKIIGGKTSFIENYMLGASHIVYNDILRVSKIKSSLKETNINETVSQNNKLASNKPINNNITDDNFKRSIICISKVNPTSNKYPRDLNKPRTKPL